MVNLEKATEIAKNFNDKFNAVQEYADAYEFFIDDGILREGGGDCSIFVLKANGEIKRWADYVLRGKNKPIDIGEPKRLDDVE